MHALYNKAINDVHMCNSFSSFVARFTQTTVQHNMLALENFEFAFPDILYMTWTKLTKCLTRLICSIVDLVMLPFCINIDKLVNFLPPKAYTRQ